MIGSRARRCQRDSKSVGRRGVVCETPRRPFYDAQRYTATLSVLREQEHVPGPAADLQALRVVHLRAVSEAVAVLVRALRLLVVEAQAHNVRRRERAQLRRLRDAVVVLVAP